jgi:hypothetical protein
MFSAITILEFMPFISSIAWRLGGIGSDATPGQAFIRRCYKAGSYLLFSLPSLLYYGIQQGIWNALILAPIFIAGVIIRRQIADSPDFPHRLPMNPDEKPFINFDWLLRVKRRDVATKDMISRQHYRLDSFTLNKMVISAFVYVPLSIFSLSFIPLLGIAASVIVGLIYYLCYNLCDYNKKITFAGGHQLAEHTVGFYYGIVDALIFFFVIGKVSWIAG